jgi:hypothetical protein
MHQATTTYTLLCPHTCPIAHHDAKTHLYFPGVARKSARVWLLHVCDGGNLKRPDDTMADMRAAYGQASVARITAVVALLVTTAALSLCTNGAAWLLSPGHRAARPVWPGQLKPSPPTRILQAETVGHPGQAPVARWAVTPAAATSASRGNMSTAPNRAPVGLSTTRPPTGRAVARVGCPGGLCPVAGCPQMFIVDTSHVEPSARRAPPTSGAAVAAGAEEQCAELKSALASMSTVPKVVHIGLPDAEKVNPCTAKVGMFDDGFRRLMKLNPDWQVQVSGDAEQRRCVVALIFALMSRIQLMSLHSLLRCLPNLALSARMPAWVTMNRVTQRTASGRV